MVFGKWEKEEQVGVFSFKGLKIRLVGRRRNAYVAVDVYIFSLCVGPAFLLIGGFFFFFLLLFILLMILFAPLFSFSSLPSLLEEEEEEEEEDRGHGDPPILGF